MDSVQEPRLQSLASIQFLKGPQAGKTFDILKPVTVIGRQSGNDIVLTDLKVSRQHARLVYDDEAWCVERLTETSTITVDQQSVAEKATIQHNSMVELGEDSSFLFLLAVQDEESNKTQRELPSPDEVSWLRCQRLPLLLHRWRRSQ